VRSFPFMRWLIIGTILAIVLRLFVVQVYQVGSESMLPTLQAQDRILVTKVDRDFKVGDLVVVDGRGSFVTQLNPSISDAFFKIIGFENLGQELFVKRVMAVGGDSLECCDADSRLLLNGQSLMEPYLFATASEDEFVIQVPPGHVWLMGDNRNNSRDSRDLLGMPGGGMIPISQIVGQVHLIVWPPARMQTLAIKESK
jgi:signal peptidase I